MIGTILFVVFLTLLIANFGMSCGNIGHSLHDYQKNRHAIITSGLSAIGCLILCVGAMMFYMEQRDLTVRINNIDNYISIQQILQRTLIACEGITKGRPL